MASVSAASVGVVVASFVTSVLAQAGSVLAFVQAPQSTSLAFDVVSIKPAVPGPRGGAASSSPDTYTRRTTNISQVVIDAYDVVPRQIVGMPAPLANARFDVTAKAAFVPSVEQRRVMLQRLLAERFAFQAHREKRELEVYALRLGKNFDPASKGFRKTDVDFAAVRAERAKPAGNANGSLNALGRPVCSGFWSAANPPPGGVHIQGNGVTIHELANLLTGYAGRMIVDETGLTGDFDADLTFDVNSGRTTSAPVGNPAPSVFTAVADVGLKLDATSAPVEVLVIDHIERPTED